MSIIDQYKDPVKNMEYKLINMGTTGNTGDEGTILENDVIPGTAIKFKLNEDE